MKKKTKLKSLVLLLRILYVISTIVFIIVTAYEWKNNEFSQSLIMIQVVSFIFGALCEYAKNKIKSKYLHITEDSDDNGSLHCESRIDIKFNKNK